GVAILYAFGRSIDSADDLPIGFVPAALALALFFGAAAFAGSTWLMSTTASLTAGLFAAHTTWQRRRIAPPSVSRDPSTARLASTPRTLDELRLALQQPVYQSSDEIESLLTALAPADAGRTVWIALQGTSAVGKTATANYLIDQILRRHP